MFFVWGTKTRHEDGGVVGDWCDTCRAPYFHRLIHYYKVSHVYYIPLGRGEYVGTNRQCVQCGTTCSCNTAAYRRLLMHHEAYGLNIEQVLEATNPLLLEQIQKQRLLECQVAQRIAQPPVSSEDMPPYAHPSDQADQRMLAALHALGTLDSRNKDVIQFRERLQWWDYLTPAEREVLLHEITAFATEDRKVNAAIHCMRLLPTPTPTWITGMGCIGLLGIWIAGFAILPFLQSWLWGSLFAVSSVALWFIAQGRASEKSIRSWVRNRLVPQIHCQDVDARYFVGLLSGIQGNAGGYEEKIADMARNVNVIADELHKQGYLSEEKEEPMAATSTSSPQTETSTSAADTGEASP